MSNENHVIHTAWTVLKCLFAFVILTSLVFPPWVEACIVIGAIIYALRSQGRVAPHLPVWVPNAELVALGALLIASLMVKGDYCGLVAVALVSGVGLWGRRQQVQMHGAALGFGRPPTTPTDSRAGNSRALAAGGSAAAGSVVLKIIRWVIRYVTRLWNPPSGDQRMHLNKNWVPKKSYATEAQARVVAEAQQREESKRLHKDVIVHSYRCKMCGKWHNGH